MNIKYAIYQTKKQSKLMIRMYQKSFDISVSLDLHIDSKDWNPENQLFVSSPIVNQKLSQLKSDVLKAYNNDYCQGVLIEKKWLQNIVSDCFNRPIGEVGLLNNDAFVFLVDFSENWLKTKSSSWKVSHNKYMGKALKGQYENFIGLLRDYEKKVNCRIVMKDITIDTIYDFISFMEENKYSVSSIGRNVNRFKFFCNRAIEENIKISNDYTKRIYLDNENDEVESVYLNEEELEKIFNLDLEHDYYLDSARDNLIISCYTGLRASDFLTNLKTDNIKDGIISIKTKKTSSYVKIPIHSYIKQILNKRFGNLPKKFTLTEYNKYIKTICMLAKIDEQVYGKLWNPVTKRKELGYHPKWAFCSSHIGRKSLVSNLKGKVSDEVLMAVGAWKSTEMMSHYNKTTKTEYASQLNDFWQGRNY